MVRHDSQIMTVDATYGDIMSWANAGQATSTGQCPMSTTVDTSCAQLCLALPYWRAHLPM